MPHTSTEPEETPQVDLQNVNPEFAAKLIVTLNRRCPGAASLTNTQRRYKVTELSPLPLPITDHHMNLVGIDY